MGPSSKFKQLLWASSAASVFPTGRRGHPGGMAQPSTPQQGSSVGAVGASQAQALFRFRGLGGLAVNLRSLTSQAASQKLITPPPHHPGFLAVFI